MKKNVLNIIGAIFLALGIIGFFNDPILGVFDTNIGNNIVYLIAGLLSFYFAYQDYDVMSGYGVVMTLIFAVITVWGLFTPNVLGFMVANTATNVLHLIFALAFIYIGFMGEGNVTRAVKS